MDGNAGIDVRQPRARTRTEYGYLTLGSSTTAAIAVLCIIDHTTIDVEVGLYALLVVLACIGGSGWLVRSGDAQRRRDLTVGLVELRTAQDELASLLADLVRQRPRPATTSCRAGMYVSQASQGDTVGMRIPSVDTQTDPAGVTIQRAREDGIEQGFEIGYRAQLAELGIPLLPTARRPRLTGDS